MGNLRKRGRCVCEVFVACACCEACLSCPRVRAWPAVRLSCPVLCSYDYGISTLVSYRCMAVPCVGLGVNLIFVPSSIHTTRLLYRLRDRTAGARGDWENDTLWGLSLYRADQSVTVKPPSDG